MLKEGRSGTAMVFVDRPPAFFDADDVLTDNLDGARRGVGHLLGHGHRRVGYLGDLQTITTAALRHQGYREELAAHGIAVDERRGRTAVRGRERAGAAPRRTRSARPRPRGLVAGPARVTTGGLAA